MRDVSPQELTKRQQMAKLLVVPGKYRHKKTGNIYVVEEVGLLEETESPAVMYRSEDEILWIRPLLEFMDKFIMVDAE